MLCTGLEWLLGNNGREWVMLLDSLMMFLPVPQLRHHMSALIWITPTLYWSHCTRHVQHFDRYKYPRSSCPLNANMLWHHTKRRNRASQMVQWVPREAGQGLMSANKRAESVGCLCDPIKSLHVARKHSNVDIWMIQLVFLVINQTIFSPKWLNWSKLNRIPLHDSGSSMHTLTCYIFLHTSVSYHEIHLYLSCGNPISLKFILWRWVFVRILTRCFINLAPVRA